MLGVSLHISNPSVIIAEIDSNFLLANIEIIVEDPLNGRQLDGDHQENRIVLVDTLLNGNFNLNITTSVFPTLVGSLQNLSSCIPFQFRLRIEPINSFESLCSHVRLLPSSLDTFAFLKSQSFVHLKDSFRLPVNSVSHSIKFHLDLTRPGSFVIKAFVSSVVSSVAMRLESDSTSTTVSYSPYWDTQSSTIEFQTPTGSASANHSASFTLTIFSFNNPGLEKCATLDFELLIQSIPIPSLSPIPGSPCAIQTLPSASVFSFNALPFEYRGDHSFNTNSDSDFSHTIPLTITDQVVYLRFEILQHFGFSNISSSHRFE